jgi:hypothetical protein
MVNGEAVKRSRERRRTAIFGCRAAGAGCSFGHGEDVDGCGGSRKLEVWLKMGVLGNSLGITNEPR